MANTAEARARSATIRDCVLEYIKDHYAKIGLPPSIDEIAAKFGASHGGVQPWLERLTREGKLVQPVGLNGTRQRRIPAVPEGHCPCCGQKKGGDV